MPAVSTMRSCRPRHRSTSSTASRVVPGRSLTRTRSSRRRRLTSDDLPTFGRPTIATATSAGWLSVSSNLCSSASRPRGNRSTTGSSRSPTPMPCSAEISTTESNPSRWNSPTRTCARRSSVLLTATTTGAPVLRSVSATSRSAGTRPSRPSTTKITTSAEAIPRRPRSTTSACSGSALAPNIPPVSMSRKDTPCHSASAPTRSLVVPGISVTIAFRDRVIRLNRVDLPTFGRPARTTV